VRAAFRQSQNPDLLQNHRPREEEEHFHIKDEE